MHDVQFQRTHTLTDYKPCHGLRSNYASLPQNHEEPITTRHAGQRPHRCVQHAVSLRQR